MAAAEDESKESLGSSSVPLSKSRVQAWDRMKKCRRYIEQNLRALSGDSEEEEELEDADQEITEERFQEIFRAHFRRKKMRKKIRKSPEVSLAPHRRIISPHPRFLNEILRLHPRKI